MAAPSALDYQIAAVLKKLHGFAASLADSRERYEATGDPRYLDSVRAVLPVYQSVLREFQGLAALAGQDELPSPFLLVLDDFSGWASEQIGQATEGVTGTLKAAPYLIPLLAVAAVLGLYFYGKRK